MAQKYKLVLRPNLGKDKAETPKKYFATAVNSGYVELDELCAEIAEQCSLTSADVKATLDRMNVVLNRHLQAGRIVRMGELGNFRVTVGSSGTKTPEEFTADNLRKGRIHFTPGTSLQNTRKVLKFERAGAETEGEDKKDGDGSERPGGL